MTDPLSVVAGIVGVAVASAQLANKVHDFADKYKNAPTQIHDIALEMSHLSSVFKLLANVLKEGFKDGSGKYKYKPRVLKDTQAILDRVRDIQDEIQDLMKRDRGVRARLKWAMSFNKVTELLDRIEALKSSLGILLNTTQLAVAFSAPRSTDLEIEIGRLKQLVAAGVKEIRHCVVNLQTSKPAVGYERRDRFDTDSSAASSEAPSSASSAAPSSVMAEPSSSVVGAASSASISFRRTGEMLAYDISNVVEPSKSQVETASWLYGMTLSEVGTHEPSEREASVPLRNRQSKKSDLLTPPFIHQFSVTTIAQNLVETWTYLDPSATFPPQVSDGEEDSDTSTEDDSSDGDESIPLKHDHSESGPRITPRRRPSEVQTIHTESDANPLHLPLPPPGWMPSQLAGTIPFYVPGQPATATVDAMMKKLDNILERKAAEDDILSKLNDLLMGKAEAETRKEAEARKTAKLAKFDRLESLLIAQQEAQIAKDKAKQQAALDAAKAVAEVRKKADQDKLAELEKLIRSQGYEQLRRDEAERQIVREKKKAREDAVLLLEVARGATEKAEEQAQRTLEETKKAYEKALANAREASKRPIVNYAWNGECGRQCKRS